LKQNLRELNFRYRLTLSDLRKISESLRGGNLRIVRVGILLTRAMMSTRSTSEDVIKSLFTKEDFPCLELWDTSEPPELQDSDEEIDFESLDISEPEEVAFAF
jgi:hypothetical protein